MKNKIKPMLMTQQEYCTDELMQLAEDVRQNACVYNDSDLWCLIDELCAYRNAQIKLEKARSSAQLKKVMRPYLDKQAMKDIFG